MTTKEQADRTDAAWVAMKRYVYRLPPHELRGFADTYEDLAGADWLPAYRAETYRKAVALARELADQWEGAA